MWSDKRVLVTGAGGFVGAWLTKALVDRGAEVVCLLRDARSPRTLDLLGLTERVIRIRGDLTEPAVVARLLNEHEIDAGFHLAAQTIVGVANRSPLSTFESNVRGTYLLLEAARQAPWMRALVVASSDKAYGERQWLPYREGDPLDALHPYDASKACADLLTRSYAESFGVPAAVTRMANVYGGGDFHASRIVPGTIRSLLRGEPVVLRSDGTAERDYLYVDDAVAGYLVLAERLMAGRSIAGMAFNFGTGAPVSVIELVGRIARIVGFVNRPAEVGPGDPDREIRRQSLDGTRAAEVLGWRPEVSLDDGLARTVEWYRRHRCVAQGE